jgi:hypothetical protein
MRVDYDSRADTIAIELADVESAEYGDDETHPRAIVAIADGAPVAVDILGRSA